jgi:hypothetical protein
MGGVERKGERAEGSKRGRTVSLLLSLRDDRGRGGESGGSGEEDVGGEDHVWMQKGG